MSTAVAASGAGSISNQIWQRLVQKGDSNGDSRLDAAELDGLQAGAKTKTDMAALVASFDQDGDGGLTADEMPTTALTSMALGTMLDWQEYGDADTATRAADDAKAVDALFARADVDGDGVLSSSEMAAERAMRQTRSLEGAASPGDPIFLFRQSLDGTGTGDGVRREDVLVGRMIPIDLTKVTSGPPLAEVVREPAVPPAQTDADAPAPTPVKTLTPEEVRQQATTALLSTPLDTSYLTRLLAQLSASIGVGGEAATG